MQVATPSRERVDQYRRLRDEIDRLVGRLNGDLGRIGSPAIHYMHTSYPKDEMAALFRAADVMVVTPLRDGMNLVAKEYVACRVRRRRARSCSPSSPAPPTSCGRRTWSTPTTSTA